ncbi:MAG: type III pantothenate kinase [Candidatus Schekmanbacteria bacterium]|nr:type III pantothenate kinase [Candidatus Schekmanbacteria bacterium]
MLFAVDIGNTSTHVAVFDHGVLSLSYRFRTETFRSADEYAVTLAQLLSLHGRRLEHVEGAAICCVVPQSLAEICAFFRTYAHCDPFVLDHTVKLPIRLAVDHPAEVGADRIANAAEAFARFRAATVVIDFGTATTFDVVDGGGAYRGGVITPGITLSAEALWSHTAKLPRVDVRKPASVVGASTVESIRAGLYYGHLSLIEGILGRTAQELGTRPKVLGTGGYAPMFAAETDWFDAVDEEVTLRGLLRIREINAAEEAPFSA